jgi:hypothetical protein
MLLCLGPQQRSPCFSILLLVVAAAGVAAWILAVLLAVWAASSWRSCPSYARRLTSMGSIWTPRWPWWFSRKPVKIVWMQFVWACSPFYKRCIVQACSMECTAVYVCIRLTECSCCLVELNQDVWWWSCAYHVFDELSLRWWSYLYKEEVTLSDLR